MHKMQFCSFVVSVVVDVRLSSLPTSTATATAAHACASFVVR